MNKDEPMSVATPNAGMPNTGASATGTSATGASIMRVPIPAPSAAASLRQQPPSYLLFRLFGPALALAASNPSDWGTTFAMPQKFALLLAVLGLWAAAPVVSRPVLGSHHWPAILARHRNTLFVGACVVTAATGQPPVWLTTADAALVLGYLLALDAVSAGPIGIRQLRLAWPAGVAAGGTAVVLALAQLPLVPTPGEPTPLGRWLAGAGAGLAGLALALAFLPPARGRSKSS